MPTDGGRCLRPGELLSLPHLAQVWRPARRRETSDEGGAHGNGGKSQRRRAACFIFGMFLTATLNLGVQGCWADPVRGSRFDVEKCLNLKRYQKCSRSFPTEKMSFCDRSENQRRTSNLEPRSGSTWVPPLLTRCGRRPPPLRPRAGAGDSPPR